jgi:hypothetical protein
MQHWLRTSPVWFRIAFFLGALWLLVVVFRLLGLTTNDETPLFQWADARYFLAMWGIFVVVYYVGLIIWNAMKKNDRT